MWKRIIKGKEEPRQLRISMPATTKLIAASEIKTKTHDFNIRRSLVDTGTDAYLRQDDSMISFPSDIAISTAGPGRLTASQSGLLPVSILVKDDKGNMHQIMLEDALVVPGLSQISHRTNNLLKMDTWYSSTRINPESH
jgi:hypothetical protein